MNELISKTRGKFFTVEFIKRDGSLRRMTCRIGVKKFVTGEGLKFDPASRGLQVVYEPRVKSYRMINLNTLLSLKCGALQWRKA